MLAAKHGMVAAGYEPRYGVHSRTHQFSIVHVLGPSLDVYSCPLAMTDGAARTLLASGNQELIERYVPLLLTRDPQTMWTSGQWMTERTGGSDVSRSETVAKQDGDTWRLYGTKWFTSATTSQMALTLARPEGNADGSRGLALFLVELRDANGRLEEHPRQPAEGQARHAQGADRGAHARRRARDPGRRRERWRSPDHADAVGDAHVERGQRGLGDAPRPRAREGLRAPAHRRSARCSSTSRCTPTRSRRSKPSTRRVLPRVPQRRAARRARARKPARAITRSGCRARSCRSRS